MKAAKPVRQASLGFSAAQIRLLSRDLDGAAVRRRQAPDGAQIAYLEGWFVIAEANAIFGYAGWQREVVHFERCFEQRRTDEVTCGYVARVKIMVDAGGKTIVREGTGFGQARGKTPAEAHELAIKSAETDATKRALATFGNRFGLGLYGAAGASTSEGADKERPADGRANHPVTLILRAPDGVILDDALSAEAFCTGLRQLIGKCESRAGIEALANLNAVEIVKIAALGLKTPRGTLYADILKRLIQKREESFVVPKGADGAADEGVNGVVGNATEVVTPQVNLESVESDGVTHRVDKSSLFIGVERRVRDKEHLREVTQMPCVICNRQPSHAHHLKFAQRHGLSQKVSDEFVVPLCALHHGDLHRASREEVWWHDQKVEPLQLAADLWARHLARNHDK